MFRRIRAGLGLGLTWVAGWTCLGALLGFVMGGPSVVAPLAFGYGLTGFVSGAAFSVALSFAERRRRFEELSMGRFAALGGATVAAFQVLMNGLAASSFGPVFTWVSWLGLTAFAAVCGAASAVGTLTLARRADERALMGPDETRLLD